MIEESYVCFQTAKLLKDKGFPQDIEGRLRYASRNFSTGTPWNSCDYKEGSLTAEGSQDNTIACPRLSLVHKWLAETHNLLILIDVDDTLPGHQWAIYFNDSHEITPPAEWVEGAFDETLEAAITYCLTNLL